MSALSEWIQAHEAGAEAVGMLESLLADGDVPPSCRALARSIVDKFHGTTTQQPKKETA